VTCYRSLLKPCRSLIVDTTERETPDVVQSYCRDFDRSRFHESELTAVRTLDFKYQASESGSGLYGLPEETTDVSGKYPAIAAELDERLTERRAEAAGPAVDATETDFDEVTKRRLTDLEVSRRVAPGGPERDSNVRFVGRVADSCGFSATSFK
jgi:hypothetical protein